MSKLPANGYMPAASHADTEQFRDRMRAYGEASRIARQQAEVRQAQAERNEAQHQERIASIFDRRRKELT